MLFLTNSLRRFSLSGPLSGVKVVEVTLFQQGPIAGMRLGDLGADVFLNNMSIEAPLKLGIGPEALLNRNPRLPGGARRPASDSTRMKC